MQKCPNCGQPAARTEDWACQWCGYPLLSKSYKKIP
ncbi:zinc ribbon domain-containing protein, partial [Chloroflexota bacterium]